MTDLLIEKYLGEGKKINKSTVTGSDVNFALPREVGMKPKTSDFKIAAKKLGITTKEAQKLWNEYTWG